MQGKEGETQLAWELLLFLLDMNSLPSADNERFLMSTFGLSLQGTQILCFYVC